MDDNDLHPRFFKVFISHHSSDSMLIPLSYYNELPYRLAKTVILQGASGGVWDVKLKIEQDEVYLAQGWSNFVRDNSLNDGDFLTFVYNGDRIFEVSIFRHDGCKEIGTDSDDEEDGVHSLSNEEDTETDSEVNIDNSIPRSMNKGKKKVEVDDSDSDYIEAFGGLDLEKESYSESSYSPDRDKAATYTRPKAKKGKSKSIDDGSSSVEPVKRTRMLKWKPTIENPEAYLDDPKNVHFETTLKNRNYELLINAEHVKDYHLEFLDHVEYVTDGGSFVRETAKWADQRVCIKDWKFICETNNVKKDDRILCELKRELTVVHSIKIHIIPG